MTETLPKGMCKLNESVYDDGSGYTASCKFFGREWYFDYTAGKRTLRGNFSQYESHRGWKNDNARKVLNKFFIDRINSFGKEWHDKHLELYKDVIAATKYLDQFDYLPEALRNGPSIEHCREYAATVAPEGSDVHEWGLIFYYRTR